jgi:hypothetical protein
MAGARSRSFDEPDDVREIPNGITRGVQLGSSRVAKMALQPGWRWSTSVKPIVETDSCQMHHLGYALAGTLHVAPEGGEELEISAGDAYEIEPGHDAWVEGSVAFEGLEFDPRTVEGYAKPDRS